MTVMVPVMQWLYMSQHTGLACAVAVRGCLCDVPLAVQQPPPLSLGPLVLHTLPQPADMLLLLPLLPAAVAGRCSGQACRSAAAACFTCLATPLPARHLLRHTSSGQ